MNKAAKYGIKGAIAGGIGNGIFNIICQLNNKTQPFDWQALLKAIGKGALVVGGVGVVIGAVKDHLNSQEVPIDTDAAILQQLEKLRLTKNDFVYQQLRSKSDWLIEVIRAEFSTELKDTPYRFGSTENGTALKGNFDIDICASFHNGSFSSTEEMYFSVLDTLKAYVGSNDVTHVRDQKKSIGVFFSIAGSEWKIDVLPHKLSNLHGNKSAGYLYVNSTGIFAKPSRTKTDISLQNRLTLSEVQKKILVILKQWKTQNDLPISSHLLKYLVIDAYCYNKGYIPRKLTDKIVMVVEYIHDNIEHCKVCSVENTNNILTNVSEYDKHNIVIACKKIIDEYQYQPNSIVRMIQ